jgi:hypothetical protein
MKKRCWILVAVVAILASASTSAPAAKRAAKKSDRGGAPDAARVAEIAKMLPEKPRGVGPTIADRAAWEAVAKARGFSDVVRRAERSLEEPMPELPDDLFLEYSRNGNRDRYQGVNSRRHSRCFNMILAECLENKGRFLPAVDEALRALLAEKTWVLPAHDGSLRNFKGEVVEIDLASSAMASAMATADYWLGEKLRPETRKLLRSELERRAFTPFEGAVTKGSPRLGWLTTTNNWNAVCLAGVTGAALTSIEDRQRRAFFVAAAEKSIQNFLAGFTPDGYCSEGLGYWNYGFGNFMVLAENVFQATSGGLDWWENPKIREIAQFGRRIEIFPGISPAFADCHIGSRGDTRLMAFVSRRYGFGWKDLEQRGLLLASGPSSGLLELGLIGFPNSAGKRPPAVETAPPGLRDWFADAGILICRPAQSADRRGSPDPAESGGSVGRPATTQPALGVALKGGHNAEHHNHNDVGSFVVALNGRTPLVDPGSEIYTARTFSGRRYDSNVLNSYGHPVPRVAGQLQQTGRQAAAKVLKTEFTDKADTLVMDISSAYAVKDLKKLQRTFVFSREGSGSLTVTDEVEFASPQTFETALITFDKVNPQPESLILVGEGASTVKVSISVPGVKSIRVQTNEIHEKLPGGLVPTRLGIGPGEPVTKAAITLTITPAKG